MSSVSVSVGAAKPQQGHHLAADIAGAAMHAATANVGSAIGAATAAAEAFKEKPYQTTAVALAALSLVFNVVVRVFSTTQTVRVALLSGAHPVAHCGVLIGDVRSALPTWHKIIAR